MATSETTNLQLVKYGAGTDNFIRTDYNGNLDKIDTFAGNTNEAITNLNDNITTNILDGMKMTHLSYGPVNATANVSIPLATMTGKTIYGIMKGNISGSGNYDDAAYVYVRGNVTYCMPTITQNNLYINIVILYKDN